MASKIMDMYMYIYTVQLCIYGGVASVTISNDQWVTVGMNATTTCTPAVSGFTQVVWYRSSFSVTNYYDADSILAYKLSTDNVTYSPAVDPSHYETRRSNDGSSYFLIVKSVTLNDTAKYWCRFYKFPPFDPVQIGTSLTQIRGVASVTISNDQWVTVGMNATTTCTPGVSGFTRVVWARSSFSVIDYINADSILDYVLSTGNIVYDPDVDPSHYETRRSSDGSSYSLIVKSVTLDDSAKYWCRFYKFPPFNPVPVASSLTQIRVLPSKVKISDSDGEKTPGATVPVDQGSSHTFTCTVESSRPAATIQWFLDDVMPSTGVGTPTSTETNRLFDTTGTWTFTPSRANHGQSVKCTGSIAGSVQPGVTVTMEVNGPPDTPVISGRTSMTENVATQLTCTADMGYPDDWTLVWSNGGSPISGPATSSSASGDRYSFTSTMNFTPSRQDNENTITCTAQRGPGMRSSEGSLGPIDVQYRPVFSTPTVQPAGSIVEGGSIVLSCSADANPKPLNYITWEKVGSPDSLPSVYNDGTSTLTITDINRNQAGSYRCRGNNVVPPVVFSGSVDVSVQYEVSILNTGDISVGANVGYDATLVCESQGNPLPRITWLRPGGEELTNETDPGRIFQVDTIPEGDDVFGFTIRSTLHISRVTVGDYRSYTCNSGNGIGMVVTLTIELNDKVKPLPPKNVMVDQGTVTATSVTITWLPGMDTGEPEWYFVNFRDVATTTGFDANTRVRIADDVTMHMIESLSPYTKYEIEVYAENANGVSQSVIRTVTTLPDTPENLDISVTSIQDTGVISVDGLPQDDNPSSCLQLEVRLTSQENWFDYGECLESNTDLAVGEARSRYCYGDLCSQPTAATTVAGQTGNSGLIAGLMILAVLLLLSIALNAVVIMYFKRRGPQRDARKRFTKPNFKPEDKRAVINEAVEYQDLDVPLQVLAAGGSTKPAASPYASISETLAAFSRDKLTIVRELGQGAFGKVLLGKADGIVQKGMVTQVAVKTLREDADITERGDLLRELDFMKQLPSNSNVVKLLGYCIDKDPIYIIMEYMTEGQLKEILTSSRGKGTLQVYGNLHGRSKSLTSRDLIKFATDVADGMAFLTSQQCIHRDLAARNVLVGENMICKVSDFGLARDVKNMRVYQRQSEVRLPLRWMALESVVDDVYTTESDVWSYGILLWEIVTLGARPYPTMSSKTMIDKLQEGYRMPRPEHCQEELYTLMLDCWSEEPTARPSFTKIGRKLEKLVEEAQDYIALSDYQESDYEVTLVGSPDEKI